MENDETWKKIKGESGFWISNDGEVYSEFIGRNKAKRPRGK